MGLLANCWPAPKLEGTPWAAEAEAAAGAAPEPEEGVFPAPAPAPPPPDRTAPPADAAGEEVVVGLPVVGAEREADLTRCTVWLFCSL